MWYRARDLRRLSGIEHVTTLSGDSFEMDVGLEHELTFIPVPFRAVMAIALASMLFFRLRGLAGWKPLLLGLGVASCIVLRGIRVTRWNTEALEDQLVVCLAITLPALHLLWDAFREAVSRNDTSGERPSLRAP
jgi:hypothetical protein